MNSAINRCNAEEQRCLTNMMTISAWALIGATDWMIERKILTGELTHEEIIEKLKNKGQA